MLTVRADQAAERIDAQMTLLQVLMHAQHEGVLHYGDIRFGSVRPSSNNPSSITLLKELIQHTMYGRQVFVKYMVEKLN